MIKTIFLVAVAAFISSSRVLVGAYGGALALVASKVRRAAAAGIPAEQRKIQPSTAAADTVPPPEQQQLHQDRWLQEAEEKCWEIGTPRTPTKIVSCLDAGVECSGGGLCCADMTSCVGAGTSRCQEEGVFAIINLHPTGCPFQYTCCVNPLNQR
jgi:hypothetical protein